jgi:hypothetical protein
VTPIEPSVPDIDVYLAWTKSAEPYFEFITESRENAIAFLQHTDSDARIAAIGSFLYHWHFDDSMANTFFHLSLEDDDEIVRYVAGSSLINMRIRCDPRDRLFLEGMILDIAKSSHDETLVFALQGFLDCGKAARDTHRKASE